MKKYLLLVLMLGGLWRFGLAQDWCPTVLNLESIQKSDPARYERILQMEEHLERYIEALDEGIARSVPAVIRIPRMAGGPVFEYMGCEFSRNGTGLCAISGSVCL